MEKAMIEVKKLAPEQAFRYGSLTLKKYRNILFSCAKDHVVAVGASSEKGDPLGLALAVGPEGEAMERREGAESAEPGHWFLCSIFVREEARGGGTGKKLWDTLIGELEQRGAERVAFQAVLKENPEKELTGYFLAMGFRPPERIAKIFSYTSEGALNSSFVRACAEGRLRGDEAFRMVSPKALPEDALCEMRKNEEEWYPPFVSPFIGWDSISQDCTVFALDRISGRVAAWVTALVVNDGGYILFRTFFTREEYRNTTVGFYTFSEAVRRYYAFCADKKALASVPTDNEKSMRFNELFFQGTEHHVSYEISAEYFLK